MPHHELKLLSSSGTGTGSCSLVPSLVPSEVLLEASEVALEASEVLLEASEVALEASEVFEV